jgi:hypothetical protein
MWNGWLDVYLARLNRVGRLTNTRPTEIVVAGEQILGNNNYRLEPTGIGWKTIDFTRHSRGKRGHHLWLDLHVSNEFPRFTADSKDPWDFGTP